MTYRVLDEVHEICDSIHLVDLYDWPAQFAEFVHKVIEVIINAAGKAEGSRESHNEAVTVHI